MSNFVEKNWSDETAGKSVIERLHFDKNKWTRVDIYVHGHKNKSTGCSTELRVDGHVFPGSSQWMVLNGTESRTYTYNLSGKESALDVVGYITNHVLFTGGGADVNVKAYYE